MAQYVFTDARVEVNSVVLSDHVRSVTLNYSAAEVDDTAMGAGTQSRLAGLKDWSVTVEWMQDHAASNVDATLFSLVGAASFPIKVRPTSGAISATNPEYTGNVVLTEYTPLTGSVGDLSTATTTFMADGNLTRSTT